MSKNIVSLQIKAHEVDIKPLKPREALLIIKESEDEDDEENKTLNISGIEEYYIMTPIFNTIFVFKINQICKTNPGVKFIRISTPFYQCHFLFVIS